MPRGKSAPATDLSRAVGVIICAARDEKGVTMRQLSLRAGMEPDRGRRLQQGQQAWSISELEGVCAVLDLITSAVVAQAEAAVKSSVTPTQDDYGTAASKRSRESGSTIAED